MLHGCKPFRTLIAAVLSLGTSAAVVCTPVLVKSGEPACVSAESASSGCCCGTADNECCGTSCCAQPSSNQVPANPPIRSGSEKDGLSLAVVGLGSVRADADFDRIGHNSGSLSIGLNSAPSLQACHVRIQT